MQVKTLLAGLATVAALATVARPAQAQNIYVDYYTPLFYMDHLLFFDEEGTPIYYDGDTPYTVPSDYPLYNEFVDLYRQHADAYHRWFQEVGYANLNYRRPIATSEYTPQYYLEYPVYYNDAGDPIYYVDGRMYRVPPDYGEYSALRAYYRARRAAYLRWYAGPGRYYRGYRRPIRTGYYNPLYYEGYVVFYDDGGRPYYYRDGRTVFVPTTYRMYNNYVSHWRTHRANYGRWYRERGRHQHAYRRPAYHRRVVVNRHAPRAVGGRATVRVYGRRGPGPGPRHVGPRPGPGPRYVGPGPRHGRPDRPVRVEHRPGPGPRFGRPGPGPGRVEPRERPGRGPEPRHGGGGVDCRRQPGHPACRGGGGGRRVEPRGQPEHRPGRGPQPAPRGEGHPGRGHGGGRGRHR